MSQSLFAAFVVFGAVMAFTPGPNNIMVLSSGLTYGFRRSLPHIAGIASRGFPDGRVRGSWPGGHLHRLSRCCRPILKYAGIAYLIYLAVA